MSLTKTQMLGLAMMFCGVGIMITLMWPLASLEDRVVSAAKLFTGMAAGFFFGRGTSN